MKDIMFVNMVNDNHKRYIEWEEVYAAGRQLVAEGRMKRTERQNIRRRENLDSVIAALGGMATTTLIFAVTAIIVLIF
jgi:CRISPR/Cas system Type II protein with McrA/HNH and RuvC-like nuclease domain